METPGNHSDNGDAAAWWSWIGIGLTEPTFEEALFISFVIPCLWASLSDHYWTFIFCSRQSNAFAWLGNCKLSYPKFFALWILLSMRRLSY